MPTTKPARGSAAWCRAELARIAYERRHGRSQPAPRKRKPETSEQRERRLLRARLRHYGIDELAYEAMLVEQGGGCAICAREDRALVIDHCHDTGVVRGLLCGPCNTSLGVFQDDPQLLRRAASYLEELR